MKRLVDVAAAADYLSTTERHIYRMSQEERLPHYKVGRKLRFDLDELDAWLDAQREAS